MIQLEQISKRFNKGLPTETLALHDINLKITPGEFVVVVGANGSGKSTLLNCIAGSIIHDSGIITIDNSNVSEWPEYKRSRYISRIFQNPLLGTAPELSILENFRLAALRTKRKLLHTGIDNSFDNIVKEFKKGVLYDEL